MKLSKKVLPAAALSLVFAASTVLSAGQAHAVQAVSVETKKSRISSSSSVTAWERLILPLTVI
nr:hypothetical protein [Paenibacillus sp. CC-CFT742]